MVGQLSQFTDNELLARILSAEAGGESPLGQQAAVSVMMNRVASPNYPNSIRGVLTQPGQFSAINDLTGYAGGQGAVDVIGRVPSSLTNQIAADALAGNINDPTGGALNYYNPTTAQPAWGGDAGQGWMDIGNHRFGTAIGGGAGSTTLAGSAGGDRLGQTSGGFLGNMSDILMGNTNPTADAEGLRRRAEQGRIDSARSREVFNTNAPTSWLNVLDSVAADAVSGLNDRRADAIEQNRDARIGQLTGGQVGAEQLAELRALDPELANRIERQQLEQARYESEIAREDRIRAEDMAREDQLRAEDNARADQVRQTAFENDMKMLEAEYGMKLPTDKRTALMRNAEAMGYQPGSAEYQEFLKTQFDSENDPEVIAAKEAAKAAAAGNNAFAKEVGKQAGIDAIGLTNAATTAAAQLPSWELARKAMSDFNSGTLAPTGQAVGQLLSSIGISDQDLESYGMLGALEALNASPGQAMSMDQLESIVNEAVIGKIGTSGPEGGFPANNFSNADLAFLQKTVPGLTDSAGGMRTKLTFLEWSDKGIVAKADSWNQRINQIRESGRQPDATDWQNFQNDWRNGPVNEQFREDLMMAVTQDRIDVGGVLTPTTPEEYQAVPIGDWYQHPDDEPGALRLKGEGG